MREALMAAPPGGKFGSVVRWIRRKAAVLKRSSANLYGFTHLFVGADAHIGPLESYKSTAFLSVRNPQLFCKLVEAQAEDLGHALLLHGDAVEYVGGLHGAAAVGDDDELGLVAHPA